MIATDVKPLECLLFMRHICSRSYFEQMKGRGCRIINSDALQMVTPDAKPAQKTLDGNADVSREPPYG